MSKPDAWDRRHGAAVAARKAAEEAKREPYRAPERFFSAPGVCIRCGEGVALGRSHIHWTSQDAGYWTCDPSTAANGGAA